MPCLRQTARLKKVALEYKIQLKEYRKLEKKHNALVERLSLMNAQTYASSKSLKGIERKKVVKGKHDDKDDFDGTPTAPTTEVPQSDSAASCDTQDTPVTSLSKERPYRKGMRYNKECVGTPIIHKSDYTKFTSHSNLSFYFLLSFGCLISSIVGRLILRTGKKTEGGNKARK